MQPGFFWLGDSTQIFVDSSCCRLKDVYDLDSLLSPGEFIFLNDLSITLSSVEGQIRPSVITKEPFAKVLTDVPYTPRDNFYLSLFIIFGFFVTGIITYANRKSFYLLLKSTISSAPIYEIMRDRSHITGVFLLHHYVEHDVEWNLYFIHHARNTSVFNACSN